MAALNATQIGEVAYEIRKDLSGRGQGTGMTGGKQAVENVVQDLHDWIVANQASAKASIRLPHRTEMSNALIADVFSKITAKMFQVEP